MSAVNSRVFPVLALSIFVGAGLAVADEGKSDKKEAAAQKSEQPANVILAGPKVEDEAKDEAAVTRMGEQRRIAPERPVQPMVWLRMVRSLDLTTEQDEKIDEIVTAQRVAARIFQVEHGEALRAMQVEIREEREAQDRQRTQELLGTMRELRAKGPQPEDVQKPIWEVLTEAQQETLRDRLAEWQKQRDEMVRERLGRAREQMSPRAREREGAGERPQQRRPALGDRPARQRGEGARPGRGAAGGDLAARGKGAEAPEPQRERRRAPRQPK